MDWEREIGAGERERDRGGREREPQKKRGMVGERKIGGGRERERERETATEREKETGEKDKQGDMSGSRRGRQQRWERER